MHVRWKALDEMYQNYIIFHILIHLFNRKMSVLTEGSLGDFRYENNEFRREFRLFE